MLNSTSFVSPTRKELTEVDCTGRHIKDGHTFYAVMVASRSTVLNNYFLKDTPCLMNKMRQSFMKHFIAKCTLSKTGISCELPSGHVYFLQIVGCTYLFSTRLSSRNQQRCKRCHVQLKNKVVTHREKVLANDYWCKVEGSGLILTNWDSLTYIVCLIHE